MSRILVVEDSPTQATLIASLLEQAGHEVVTAFTTLIRRRAP